MNAGRDARYEALGRLRRALRLAGWNLVSTAAALALAALAGEVWWLRSTLPFREAETGSGTSPLRLRGTGNGWEEDRTASARPLVGTARYVARCAAEAGHLVVIDQREDRSWNEKTFHHGRRPARPQSGAGAAPVDVWGM